MRTKLLTAFAASALIALATAPSAAAVTIGQTGPPGLICIDNVDRLQPTVTAGNGYVVPGTVPNWSLTSWSTQSFTGTEPMGMKVYRPLGGLNYRVVGHDGPHALNPSALNTFSANVAVKAGDVLGLTIPPGSNPGCAFNAAGETGFLSRTGNLADGEEGTFANSNPNFRLNISAVITPTNAFTLGAVTRNKKKGTATIIATVPNPGDLTATGTGVKASGAAVTSKAVGAGAASLTIRAKGKKKRKLNDKGKVKLNAAITFTPTGGDPSTQTTKVKLKKKL